MKDLEQQINKILADSVTTPEEKAEYEKALTILEDTTGEMSRALIAGDTDAYLLARDRRINAGGIIEMYKARARAKESGPLISESEYNELVKAIEDKAAEATEKAKKTAVKYCLKLQVLARENSQDIAHADRLLKTLQADIYKYADCPKRKNGEPMITSANEKRIKDYSLPAWTAFAIENCAQYKAMSKDITPRTGEETKQ